jgi:hypothetical protein
LGPTLCDVPGVDWLRPEYCDIVDDWPDVDDDVVEIVLVCEPE